MIEQISMFIDPIDEKVRDRLKMYLTDKWGKAFDTEKKIDHLIKGFSGGMVGDFCWEVRNGILYASDRTFNNFEPDATVRKYTKEDLMEMAQEMEES